MHLAIGDTWGMMFRQMYDEVGLPWMKTTVGDVGVGAPVSMYAIDESRTGVLSLVKGNAEEISC